jgi:hypothetical protein
VEESIRKIKSPEKPRNEFCVKNPTNEKPQNIHGVELNENIIY